MECNKNSRILQFVVAAILGVGSIATMATAVAGGSCDISGCTVTAPSPPYPGSGGSWGGSYTDDPCLGNNNCNDYTDYCAIHIASKPPSCPNPIPVPSGHAYGKDSFPAASGLARVIYFVDHQNGVSESARQKMKEALALQTTGFSSLITPFDQVMNQFTVSVREACEIQKNYLDSIRAPGIVTDSERQCLRALDTVLAEYNNQAPFFEWFVSWLNLNNMVLNDLGIPQTAINLLSPENSLKIKYEKVTTDAICAKWWDTLEMLYCSN